MSEAAFASVLTRVSALIEATPELAAFAPDTTPEWTERPPYAFAATARITDWIEREAPDWACLVDIAPHAEWRQSYTAEEVGATFLDNYAYTEIIRPKGHYRSDTLRAYIGWWGPGLFYPWHDHEAEEIYYILAGHAEFESDGLPPARLGPGDTRLHTSRQRHAMTTTDSAILALALWRGAGIEGIPEISRGGT